MDANVVRGLRAMGVGQEEIEGALQAQRQQAAAVAGGEPDFEVHEDCWESVLFFLRVQTQWRYRGMEARRCALDYVAVEAAMRMSGVTRRQRAGLLDDMAVMELAVLAADHEAAKTPN